jgi:D-tagatose-1,6-bisphosphate aldolase subunit GatZ/KbaZ
VTKLPIDHLDKMIAAHIRGEKRGIPSICSSHPVVLEAAFRHAKKTGAPLLIEATCNQVNQFGGYTGMTPELFSTYMSDMAAQLDFPTESLVLGGDHLGPEVWKDETAAAAMAKAGTLIRDCVSAGYLKIHLDASMKLGDDPAGVLSKEVAADRSAELTRLAEETVTRNGLGTQLRYVIGSEVPLPGGAQEIDETIQITTPEDVAETIELTRKAFAAEGLEAAWERVIAVVVQPGVEYGDDFIVEYQRESARGLTLYIESQPLVFEAHSTDYQLATALSQMVEDHFAILKVGPALTFAYREAVFALAMMEKEILPTETCSNLVKVLDEAMVRDPQYWSKYYLGDENSRRFARKFSLSDRSRYYWPVPEVQTAVGQLMRNLKNHPPPRSLISQYMPAQYEEIRHGKIHEMPQELIRHKIFNVLDAYHEATRPSAFG